MDRLSSSCGPFQFELNFTSPQDLAVDAYISIPLLKPISLGRIVGNVDKFIVLKVDVPDVFVGSLTFYNHEDSVFVERAATILGTDYSDDIELIENP